jgi:hypothetical protein
MNRERLKKIFGVGPLGALTGPIMLAVAAGMIFPAAGPPSKRSKNGKCHLAFGS